MKRTLMALCVASALSILGGTAEAALLAYSFSGQFPPCGSFPCGPYSGTFVIDTSAAAIHTSIPGSDLYPLASGAATLNPPPTLLNSSPLVGILNSTDPSTSDGLIISFDGGIFKISFSSPWLTITDTLLTESNVSALINDATNVVAYCKECVPGLFLNAETIQVTRTGVPEPATLVLFTVGLVGMVFSLLRDHC